MKISTFVSLFSLLLLAPAAGWANDRCNLNNGIGTEKIKAVQGHVVESLSQLNGFGSMKAREEAVSAFEKMAAGLDAASALAAEVKAEVEKNMAVQKSDNPATQKYVDLQSDLVELHTELARMKRHVLAAGKKDSLEEINEKVKYLQKGFSELDIFLRQIEKDILSIQ